MSETITQSTTYERQDCVNCGVAFFIPKFLDQMIRSHKGQSFYCPNGHSMSYREGDVERLKRELNAARQREETIRKQTETALFERDVARAAVTSAEKTQRRLRKRIAAGVCPCCHRTVSQMARHMKTKHPEFEKEPAKAEPKLPREKSAYVKNRLGAIIDSQSAKEAEHG